MLLLKLRLKRLQYLLLDIISQLRKITFRETIIMKLIVNNLRLPLRSDTDELKILVAKKMGISVNEIESFRIARESIDARRKPDVSRVYSVAVTIGDCCRFSGGNDVKHVEQARDEEVKSGNRKLHNRPIIIGSGPSGMFA